MVHEGSVTNVRQHAVVLLRDAQVLVERIAMIGHPLTVKAAAVIGTKMGRQSNPPARRIPSSDGFRKTPILLERGLGSALLPKPDSCHAFAATLPPYRGGNAEGTVSDLLDESGARPENAPPDKAENPAPSGRSWLGRLAMFLAPIAGEVAVNDFSGSLGYPGLAGVVALTAVVAVAAWIRGAEPARATAPVRPVALHRLRRVLGGHSGI
jgi:hypothetical protein